MLCRWDGNVTSHTLYLACYVGTSLVHYGKSCWVSQKAANDILVCMPMPFNYVEWNLYIDIDREGEKGK